MGCPILLNSSCSVVLRLIAVLLILLSARCDNLVQALKCYTNGDTDSHLRYERGKEGLMECNANSQCVEAVAPDDFIKELAYKSGCHYCPFQRGYKCTKCHTDFCNNEAANEIRKNNRLCYSAGQSLDIGQETVWCIPGEEHCYYWVNSKSQRFFAGCGSGYPPNCRQCIVCKGNLCNYPAQFEDTRLKPSAYVTPGSPSSPKQAPTQASETKPKPKPEEKRSEKQRDLPPSETKPKPRDEEKRSEKPRDLPPPSESTPAVKEKPKDAAAAGESSKDPEDASSQADDADTQKEKAPAKATTQKSKDDKKAAARCKPPKCRKGGNGSETAADVKKKVKKLGDDEDDSGDPDEARDTGSAVRVRLITVIVTTGTALIARIARI